jgi:hypothetical protein
MNHSGGLQKMATPLPNNSLTGTTRGGDSVMEESQNCFAAPAKNSCCEHGNAMLCGFGEDSKTIADKPGSTVPFSEMKATIFPATLSDRLTQSLISAGLVCGTIPLSMRDASGQTILGFASKPLAGEHAGKQRAA